MGIHISKILRKPKTIKYWRKATKDEIKFGYGATHYRDFDFESCFDEEGFQKDKVRASDDKLIYYYTGLDCITNLELKKLIVI
jgi:hypothetical protein